MQQHAVPQQIASYEFRLVGDMTLKQFGWLAGGAMIGLLFYSLPIVPMVKWSLILTAGFTGFAFAFLPVEERPLSVWVLAFVQAVYAPTYFFWKKKSVIPSFFTYKLPAINNQLNPTPPVDATQLNQYLQTLPGQITEDAREKDFEDTAQPVKLMIKPIKIDKKPVVVAPSASDNNLLVPLPATKPNSLVGVILDLQDHLVDGAIIEIKNPQGETVRALKTNRLGQFMIATPLANDTYVVETEKECLKFDTIKVEVKGEIIPPLKIKAT